VDPVGGDNGNEREEAADENGEEDEAADGNEAENAASPERTDDTQWWTMPLGGISSSSISTCTHQ
jgi:hypothetical protein